MIREIINFTNNLIEDIPDIMEWKVQPSKGLHIFIDLDESGRWINNNPQKEDFVFFHSEENANIKELIKYENKGKRVGTTMNKVLACIIHPHYLSYVFVKKSFHPFNLTHQNYTIVSFKSSETASIFIYEQAEKRFLKHYQT